LQKLSDTQKKFLVEASRRYNLALDGSPAEEYLANRGLVGERADALGFGYVADPLPGHEYLRGRLAIPYLRPAPSGGISVINIKFRCIEDHDCKDVHPKAGKYIGQTGGGTHIYNTNAIIRSHDEIIICEGELDAATWEVVGLDAVGLPGTESWMSHFGRIFPGYATVYFCADTDDAKGQGMAFAEKLGQDKYLRRTQFKIIPMPGGDVNATYVQHGAQALWKAIGKEMP
jgi:DNA primase